MTYTRTFEVTVTWKEQPTADEYGLVQEALAPAAFDAVTEGSDLIEVSVSDPGYVDDDA